MLRALRRLSLGSLLVTGVGLPTIRVTGTILINRRTTSDARATVHSLLSQAENLGEILFGLLLAATVTTTSPTVTLVMSAALIALAGATVSRTTGATDERASITRETSRDDVENPGPAPSQR